MTMVNIGTSEGLNLYPLPESDAEQLQSVSLAELMRSEKVLNDNDRILSQPSPFGPEGTNPAQNLAGVAKNQQDVLLAMFPEAESANTSPEAASTKASSAAASTKASSAAAIAAALRQALQHYAEQLKDFKGKDELSDDEMEEVNRIGDVVKMINESLKHWINTVKEEKMSIARNI